jgi:hypothetical protein
VLTAFLEYVFGSIQSSILDPQHQEVPGMRRKPLADAIDRLIGVFPALDAQAMAARRQRVLQTRDIRRVDRRKTAAGRRGVRQHVGSAAREGDIGAQRGFAVERLDQNNGWRSKRCVSSIVRRRSARLLSARSSIS